MAIRNLSENDESFQIEINNGDFKALTEVSEKWNFKDKESALRFAIAVLSMTDRSSLFHGKNDGSKVILQPSESMINKE